MVARGQAIENLEGLLVTITRWRAVDVYRQRKDGLFTDGPLKEHYADNSDLIEQVDDRQKLDRLVRRMVGRLNAKERNAVTLCLLHGYTRPEAAKLLGMSEPAFQKIMDRARRKIAGYVAGIDARGCGDEEWGRLLRDFAFGLIGEDHPDYVRVVEHIEECEPCKRYVMVLRGLAAVLPPVAPFGHGIATGMAHVYRLLVPGHGAAAAGSSAGSGVLASTGAASSSGTGGLISVFGGGAAKTLAIAAAGIAAAGTVTVQVVRHHHRPASQVQQAAHRQSSLVLGAPPSDQLEAPRAWPFPRRGTRTRPVHKRSSSHGIQAARQTIVTREPVQSIPASSASQQGASTRGKSTSPPPSSEGSQGPEFGFESSG